MVWLVEVPSARTPDRPAGRLALTFTLHALPLPLTLTRPVLTLILTQYALPAVATRRHR